MGSNPTLSATYRPVRGSASLFIAARAFHHLKTVRLAALSEYF